LYFPSPPTFLSITRKEIVTKKHVTPFLDFSLFTNQNSNLTSPSFIIISHAKRDSNNKSEDWGMKKQNIKFNYTFFKRKKKKKEWKKETFWPRSMYFMATSSLVSLFLMSLATPKFPAPKSLTASYFSIIKSLYSAKDVTFYYGYEWKKGGSNLKLETRRGHARPL